MIMKGVNIIILKIKNIYKNSKNNTEKQIKERYNNTKKIIMNKYNKDKRSIEKLLKKQYTRKEENTMKLIKPKSSKMLNVNVDVHFRNGIYQDI